MAAHFLGLPATAFCRKPLFCAPCAHTVPCSHLTNGDHAGHTTSWWWGWGRRHCGRSCRRRCGACRSCSGAAPVGLCVVRPPHRLHLPRVLQGQHPAVSLCKCLWEVLAAFAAFVAASLQLPSYLLVRGRPLHFPCASPLPPPSLPLQRKCRSIGDKYVEFEDVLVFLDMMLHRVEVYRHLLINRRAPARQRGHLQGLPVSSARRESEGASCECFAYTPLFCYLLYSLPPSPLPPSISPFSTWS